MEELKELLQNEIDLTELEEVEEMVAPACGCGCTDGGMGC